MDDFVHGVEVSLEEDEIVGSWAVLVEDVVLELLESVSDLEEILLLQEEVEILGRNLLDDGLNWVEEGILVKVLLHGFLREVLNFVDWL